MTSRTPLLALLALIAPLAGTLVGGAGAPSSEVRPQDPDEPLAVDPFADLRAAFATQGIGLDATRGS